MPGDYWGPPEITTARLQSGPGPVPMTEAAAAWTAKAAQYTAQASRYVSIVSQAGAVWTSPSGAKMVASAGKMAIWLGTAAALAAKAAEQAAAQAAAYTTAYVGVPQLEEIASNHTTHAVLEGTNFLGINTIPIAVNEFDYAVRMTAQAATTMAGYESATMSNLMSLPTFSPPDPMTLPGVGTDALASSGFLAAAGTPAAIDRDTVFSAGAGSSIFSIGMQQGGRLASTVGAAEGAAEAMGVAAGLAGQQAGSDAAEASSDDGQQLAQSAPITQNLMQSVMQAPEAAMQAPSQLTQGVSQLTQGPQQLMSPLQQLLSPLQSMMSANGGGYGLDVTGTPVDQVGLVGASPLSNHPLAGGTGVAAGAGLLTGSAVPGAGGMPARTPLLGALTAASVPVSELPNSAEVTAGAAAGRAGAAPVGAMPMGAMGGRRSEEGTVDGLVAPAPLVFGDEVDDLDDWSV